MLRTLGTVLLIALVLYGALLALLWWRQESLLFFPQPLPPDHQLAHEPGVHELTVNVSGANLSVLHLKLPNPKGVVFFLHGNAGNLAGWFGDTGLYRSANFDLVMMDYRGYGKSTGQVDSERQLREDVRAVWNAIVPHYTGRKRVLLGRSLGTALAADLGAELTREGTPPDLTVLVSPYTSMGELASELYPWVPRALLRYPLDTVRHAQETKGAILLVHGGNDTLIDASHSQRLAARLPRAKLEIIPRAGHNDIDGYPAYEQALRRELEAL